MVWIENILSYMMAKNNPAEYLFIQRDAFTNIKKSTYEIHSKSPGYRLEL
jgi:hypothetical protein